MIKPEQIPDAAAFALDDARKDPDASPWDLIAAAINAWPGVFEFMRTNGCGSALALPLPETRE
jgi:hypothetical protein